MQNRTEPRTEQNRTDEMKLYKVSQSVWPYYVNLRMSDIRACRETTKIKNKNNYATIYIYNYTCNAYIHVYVL